MSLELMIFRAGNYPQGDWPKERVQKMVDAYDPVKNVEAPVVIGHRYYGQTDEYQYAHGWVQALRVDGAGKVWATVNDFSADVKKAIAEKNCATYRRSSGSTTSAATGMKALTSKPSRFWGGTPPPWRGRSPPLFLTGRAA